MASNRPKTRNDFKSYILRKTGVPYHKPFITDEQLEDTINDALRFYGENCNEGTTMKYYNLDTSSQAREYNLMDLLPNTTIFAVEEVIDTSGFGTLYPTVFGLTQTDIDFLFSLGRLEGNNLVDFELQLQRISAVRKIVSEKFHWHYNFNTGIFTIDSGVPELRKLGLILDVIVDYDGKSGGTGNIWTDRLLQDYTLGMVLVQMSRNMGRYSNFSIPGGGVVNFEDLRTEGQELINNVKEEVFEKGNSDPSIFYVHMG